VAEATVPQIDRSPVWELAKQPQRIVHPRLGDATDHHGLADAAASQEPHPTAELDHACGAELVAHRRQVAVVLVAKADATHTRTSGADAFRHEQGQPPLACDEPDGLHYFAYRGW
jgi:hypothetical protein